MFNLGQNAKVRGSGHLILNAIRALTIVTLGTTMVSCWAMIVLSGMTNHFQFFDTMSHFFIFVVSVFLVISEVNLFKAYFANNWPVLSHSHSLAWLGLAMVMMGTAIMGDLVKPAYQIDNIGLAMWRLVLAAGILCITFGFFNIIASLIFRDGTNKVTARMIRSDGNLAGTTTGPFKGPGGYDDSSYYQPNDTYSHRSNSVRQTEEEPSRFNRMTRMFNPKNLNIGHLRRSRLNISAPMPIAGGRGDDVERYASDHVNDKASSPNILNRPPTALHPAFTGSSRYSEARMPRFDEKI